MSERDSPSREFLQFPAEGNSSIRLLYVGESPELLGSWSTMLELGACKKLKHGGHNVEGEVNATNQQGVILEWPLVNLKGNDEVIPLDTKPY